MGLNCWNYADHCSCQIEVLKGLVPYISLLIGLFKINMFKKLKKFRTSAFHNEKKYVSEDHLNRAHDPLLDDSPSPRAIPPVLRPASPSHNGFDSPPPLSKRTSSKKHTVPILAGVIGCAVFILISSIGIYFCKIIKVANVRPWATGLSGQLQKAFVTGSKLSRV